MSASKDTRFIVYDEFVKLTPEMSELLKKYKHKIYVSRVVIDEREKEVDTGSDQETRSATQSSWSS